MVAEKQHYCKAVCTAMGWRFVVYRYDESGGREIVVNRSAAYDQRGEALDAAVDWCDAHSIDAELDDSD